MTVNESWTAVDTANLLIGDGAALRKFVRMGGDVSTSFDEWVDGGGDPAQLQEAVNRGYVERCTDGRFRFTTAGMLL